MNSGVVQQINATRCLEGRTERLWSQTPCADCSTSGPSGVREARRYWRRSVVRNLEMTRGEHNGRPGASLTKWVLADERTLVFGAHLGTPRLGYLHHGIYVGGGHVVHYAGYVNGVHRGPVEEIELARFTDGRSLWIASGTKSIFESSEVIRRARSRLGESRYRLTTNNCEHVCEWCVTGEPRSFQVEAWLAWPRRAVAMLVTILVGIQSRLRQIGSGRMHTPLNATDAPS